MLDNQAHPFNQPRDLVKPEVTVRENDVQVSSMKRKRADEGRTRRVDYSADEILRAVGRKNQPTLGPKHTGELSQARRRVEEVLDNLDAEYQVERSVREGQAFHVCLYELDLEPVTLRPAARRLEDTSGNISPDHTVRTIRQPRDAGKEASIPAPGIEQGLGRQPLSDNRDHSFELPATRRIGKIDRFGVLDRCPTLIDLPQGIRRSCHDATLSRPIAIAKGSPPDSCTGPSVGPVRWPIPAPSIMTIGCASALTPER